MPHTGAGDCHDGARTEEPVGALAGLDDVRFLLDIADTDPDARVRHEAVRALSLLPLDPGAARAVLSLSSIHEWDPPVSYTHLTLPTTPYV